MYVKKSNLRATDGVVRQGVALCLQIVQFAGGVQVRCPQKKKKHEQSSCLSFCGAVYAKQMGADAPRAFALTLRVYLFAMSAAHDFCKCCALASLFACGLPRLAHQRLLPKVNRVQRTVPVPTMQALLPTNCSICRGSSSSVSAKKRKNTNKVRAYLFVVRSPRLELGRCNHTPLKRTRLPIPP